LAQAILAQSIWARGIFREAAPLRAFFSVLVESNFGLDTMGSLCSGQKQPREDVPTLDMGPLNFVVKADSYFTSNTFTIHDTEDTPWLRWEGSNFDDAGGKAELFRAAKSDQERPLVTLDISGVNFQEVMSKNKDDEGWFSEGDVKTKLKWKISREVTVSQGNKVCGKLKVEYEGIAEAKKDVDYGQDGREVKWKKSARTQSVKHTMSIGGENVEVSVSPGAGAVSLWDFGDNGWNWNQTYQCGSFRVEYVAQHGCDEVNIATQGNIDPLIAIAVGFALGYWMHPKRVEDDAANKALAMVMQRSSGW